MIFASERLQSPGEEGEQRQEDGVCGGVPPQSHAQWRDALHHEFHAEVGPVEHEVERHEDEAPEQEFAFHDPHAFEVGFDGLLFVEKEPSGDGEEDDDADFTAALHHELEEDAFRSQGEFQHVIAVVDDEVVHEDHEHRDDAQQFDAGVSWHVAFDMRPVHARALAAFAHPASFSRLSLPKNLWSGTTVRGECSYSKDCRS